MCDLNIPKKPEIEFKDGTFKLLPMDALRELGLNPQGDYNFKPYFAKQDALYTENVDALWVHPNGKAKVREISTLGHEVIASGGWIVMDKDANAEYSIGIVSYYDTSNPNNIHVNHEIKKTFPNKLPILDTRIPEHQSQAEIITLDLGKEKFELDYRNYKNPKTVTDA